MNPVTKKAFLVDKDDSSVTRSDELMRAIFEKAGLEILLSATQSNFPDEMLPVITYALVPKRSALAKAHAKNAAKETQV